MLQGRDDRVTLVGDDAQVKCSNPCMGVIYPYREFVLLYAGQIYNIQPLSWVPHDLTNMFCRVTRIWVH